MRKQVDIEVCDVVVPVELDFNFFQKIEEVYGCNLDFIPTMLTNARLKYSLLATAIADVVLPHSMDSRDDKARALTKADIKDYVMTADSNEIARYGLTLCAACFYVRKHKTEDEVDDMIEQGNELVKKSRAEALATKNSAPAVSSSDLS